MAKKTKARSKRRTKKAPPLPAGLVPMSRRKAPAAEQPAEPRKFSPEVIGALSQLEGAGEYVADARNALVDVLAAWGSDEDHDMLAALSRLATMVDVAGLCVSGAERSLRGEASNG